MWAMMEKLRVRSMDISGQAGSGAELVAATGERVKGGKRKHE
jgi:hypothetical protein